MPVALAAAIAVLSLAQCIELHTMRLQASILTPPASSESRSFDLGAAAWDAACFAFAACCLAACGFTAAAFCGA